MISIIGRIFGFAWFVWPFVFVYSLAWGVRDWVHDDKCSPWPLFIAGLSLTVIIGGIISFM